MDTYIIVDIEETALVVECSGCGAAIVITEPQPGIDFQGTVCPNCKTELIPLRSPRPDENETIVDRYRALLRRAKLRGPAEIRLRVPISIGGPPQGRPEPS